MSTMDYYKVFYQAALSGSLTKAAQELYITQPSASYAIKQLEEQLGVRLLERKAKGVELTGEGQALFHFVEQAYRLLQAGERKIGEMKTFASGVVRLGASDSLCKHFALPFLERFRRAHPGIRILLSHGKSAELTSRLVKREIDCAIVHLPAEDGAHVNVLASRELESCFIAGPALARQLGNGPISLAELIRHPFVTLSAHSRTSAYLHALLHSYGLSLVPDIELGSVDLLLEFVRRDMGVALTTREFVVEELADGRLFELRAVELIPARSIGVVTMPEGAQSHAAALFSLELADFLCK
ncbi:LysR family transcriptional regulator [Paenibacillus koleovorans]|uniref:LysR family transcriptional regulator n=1 Tax=Paenibacillus koleovorans TaxID=121608 RepID=UPI000FD7B4A7|nr:LysR family transcriptional regulator [Paenibacillus koleovorans]